MDNNNFDKKKLIENYLSASNGKIDRNAVKKAAQSGNADALIQSLSQEDKQKLNAVLNDKSAMEALLKSPQAAAIMKMLSGGGKNG